MTELNQQEIAKFWRGKSIKNIINHYSEKNATKNFFFFPEAKITKTYLQLKTDAQNLVAELKKNNIHKGDGVAYALGNGPCSLSIIIASLYGGFRTTPINIIAGKNNIEYTVKHCEAKIIFANHEMTNIIKIFVEKLKLSIKIIECNENDNPLENLKNFENLKENSTPQQQQHSCNYEVLEDDVALLMYTSGSTGRPKGVIHTHKSIISGGVNTAIAHGLLPEDRGLCVLPLYHINAFCVSLMGSLVSGGSIVIPPRFSTSKFFHYIKEYNCSWFSVVPTMISYLLHEEYASQSVSLPKSLRFGRSASAALSTEVQKSFEKKFQIPIIETMGLTETAAQILANPMPPLVRKGGSPGIAYGNQVKLKPQKQQQYGEIIVKGDNLMKEYFKDKRKTKNAFTNEGWFRTGDLASIDQDNFFFVKGRIKEIIIKGGENISPREIDEVLYAHPCVIEAAAFPRDCPRYGQTVIACVVVKDKSIDKQELLQLCLDRLGRFKKPDDIFFMDALPKGPSGKINRKLLAHMFAR